MRVPLPHELGKDEVRRRMKARSHEIADAIPGGMAEVETSWPNEDCMALDIKAMGNVTRAQVLIEDTQVIFEIDLPPALSFVEPVIAGAIRKKGQKLLEAK
ncbi:polyhydroxyalkanoic acid system family protein [Qipengyuania aquimaris]|uniref:Polyhydroxyalkanoic acid system family protein n=1 Tax=Qipengyuania aquimaris TaxID=255984 RepID=A0A9Q3S298_9SPHN|nr:polyhydroxyalkanoic acid system family protein [Qipengyuania aquimaris]MBY6127806.1 polyhydroxyalkanoic acid system family protein [Qipengyuania aquimaris]MBY6218658.1 polyhydroxyalkanoic acid system family protein [Qipengyuania aquimaris]UOR15720.1 polyhydroxyalkanoic acid system family protein [Qipengyuania aquimaris]